MNDHRPLTVGRVSAALAVVALPLLAAAQDNIGHTRHRQTHNDPHPTVVDGTRFHTTRASDVELSLPTDQPSFTFAVFGDRTGGPDSGVSILADAVRDVNLLEPDLVMTVGDMIQGYGQREPWMDQMREYTGIMDELLCPWFPVAGNHDIYWRGDNKPAQEHEDAYEMHFGPLWYAFEHKDCLFVVMYTDEGDPVTGERSISRAASQTMSPEQLSWLEGTLAMAQEKGMRDVFCFLHHPRWIGGRYGDDWEKVHDVLVDSGLVRAVFAGHIHQMRYDPQDGIDYITLATTGGHQNGSIPDIGWLHHYHVCTVRDGQFSVAAVPVGEVLDVREITPALRDEVTSIATDGPTLSGMIEVDSDGAAETTIRVTVRNPASCAIDVSLTPESGDSRWTMRPDHMHMDLAPGASRVMDLWIVRDAGSIDGTFRLPKLRMGADYLGEGFRYAVPERAIDLPIRLREMPRPVVPIEEMAMICDGRDDHALIEAAMLSLPDGPFTLECWCRADSFGRRVGLLAKTESSEYGIFVNRGQPHFAVHLDGAYANAQATEPVLKVGTWHHVAGVFDGETVSLFVDGELVARGRGSGTRTTNDLPFMIGADVNRSGHATSHFDGKIDGVRLSTVARYTDAFQPDRRVQEDAATMLLLNMDGRVGPWLYNESASGPTPMLRGARIGAAGR